MLTEGLWLLRKGNVPSIKHSHVCKSMFSWLAITTWQQWGRGSPYTALTRWQSRALIKCLVALHSIVPAAYNWGGSAAVQGGERHHFSEPELFMLTNFPTAKGVPVLTKVPLGPRHPDSSVPTLCSGHLNILPVIGNSIHQNCNSKCSVEEFVLNWLCSVQKVARVG